jgi:hypothetical protein
MKGSSFKMKQTTKRIACMILDAHERGEYLRLMISAQKAAEHHATSRVKERPARTESQDSE